MNQLSQDWGFFKKILPQFAWNDSYSPSRNLYNFMETCPDTAVRYSLHFGEDRRIDRVLLDTKA